MLMTIPYGSELAAGATALMWVFCSLAFTRAGRRVGSLSVNVIRLAIAGVFYVALSLIVSGQAVPLHAPGRTWAWLSVSGLVGFFIAETRRA